MKKLLLSSAVFCLLASHSAFASDVSVGINIGGGPVVEAPPAVIVAPQPVVVGGGFVDRGPGYDPHHHDHAYWAARQREEERRAHERMERERHDHGHDDHHGGPAGHDDHHGGPAGHDDHGHP